MLTRRQLFRVGAVTAAGVLLSPARFADPRGAAAGPGAYSLYAPLVQRARATLNPTSLPKFVTPMVIPPAMPRTSTFPAEGGQSGDYYEIAVRQFAQQILPAGWPTTTVWSYGSENHAGTFNYPAFTIEARWNAPVRVKWIN